MNYLIGDLQGCCDALDSCSTKIDFSPSRDRLYVLGDLVNRGPQSLAHPAPAAQLRRLGDLPARQPRPAPAGGRARACGTRARRRHARRHPRRAGPRGAGSTGCAIGAWPCSAHGWLMVHAGVVPQWDAAQTLAAGGRGRGAAAGRRAGDFLQLMYGDEPLRWDAALVGAVRLRFIDQRADAHPLRHRRRHARADTKEAAHGAPAGFLPWFEAPGRRTQACRSPSATGPRSASSTGPTCSRSTPAASGAAH